MVRKFLTIAACAGALLTGTSAFAADMTVATYDWTGVYAGVNVGWASLHPKSQAANLIQPKSSGFLGGVRLGYNHQINQIVLGAELDANFTDLSKTVSCFNAAFNCNAASDWNGSLKARLGFAADRFMVFGAAGVAIADYNGFTSLGATKFSDSKTRHGWVLGAGIEYAVTDTILLNAEYDHMQFRARTLQYDIPYKLGKSTIDQFKVGVSWKF
jgi:outer membrane immunogenic protein